MFHNFLSQELKKLWENTDHKNRRVLTQKNALHNNSKPGFSREKKAKETQEWAKGSLKRATVQWTLKQKQKQNGIHRRKVYRGKKKKYNIWAI